MHSGNHLNVSAGTAASKWGANSAQHRLIDENETRLFGLSRLDQSFPNGPMAQRRVPAASSVLFSALYPRCNRTASSTSGPIPRPESSSGMSRYRSAGLRHHAHVDQAGQGQVAPATGQGLEAAGGAGLVDLQTALAHGRHLAEYRHEGLLIHPLEQLQGLEAGAHGVLPQSLGLLGP